MVADSKPLRVHFEAYELDEANARLTRAGRAVPLPPKALALLCTLARQHGQLVTRNDLRRLMGSSRVLSRLASYRHPAGRVLRRWGWIK